MQELERLERSIGYAFGDRALLEMAMTHPSRAVDYSNQRLEFLGDAVLQLCVSQRMMSEHTEMAEGDLSRLRASIVCEASLAAAARKICLGDYLRLGRGERNGGGAEKTSVLSDALEALLGAVFLDGGLEKADVLVGQLLGASITASEHERSTDYKTELQERLQKLRHTTPTYQLVAREGPAHETRFIAACCIDGHTVAQGEGRSKKRAEQQAARRALEWVRAGNLDS